MPDTLSLPASVFSLVSTTIQSVQILAKTMDDIKDVPIDLRSIRLNLNAVESVLQQLQDAINSNPHANSFSSDRVAPALRNCDRACTVFRQTLDNWIRYSNSKGGTVIDERQRGILSPGRTQALSAQLDDCKATLMVVLSTAVFITLARAEEDESDKALLLQSREQKLQRQLTKAWADRSAIESRMHEMASTPETSSTNNDFGIKEELETELRYQRRSNQFFSETCEDAISQLAFERTGHQIHVTRAKDNSSALAGVFNASSVASKNSLDISDTSAETMSFAHVGIHDDYDYNILVLSKT